MSVTILHITDIHAGPQELKDEDFKQHVPGSERKRMLERLTGYLRVLPAPPDYVIVTGDLTIRGDEQGFADFQSWISDRADEGALPSFDQIIVTPGNHDVVRGSRDNNKNKERYSMFFDMIGKVFPHAYLPGCDPPLDPKKPNIDVGSSKPIGGVRTKERLGKVEVTTSYPFILDLEKNLLIFAFNSTLGCSIYLPPLPEVTDNLDVLLKLYKDDKTPKSKLEQIRDAYEQSLVIDAGLIGKQQLDYFSGLMRRLRETLGSKYTHLTKIAILHHHISHLWRQQLEVKTFESILDAAQLKQQLIECEFDMVFHGHKHTNHVALDASMIPISSTKQFSPLCIVSGGTIGGYPRLNDKQTFKLIGLDQDSGPRTTASIREVPLTGTADPGSVIEKESKIYQVPISARLPELHDFQAAKDALDAFMRDRYAPELVESKHLIIEGKKFSLPAAHPDIVGQDSRYNCDRVVETTKEKIFYDIILATQRLDFRQKARIYWMLTDVQGLKEPGGKRPRVIILVGNLEETHFFEGETKGEVRKSLDEIEKWFHPASQSGLLEIRQHVFSQKEMEELASTATE